MLGQNKIMNFIKSLQNKLVMKKKPIEEILMCILLEQTSYPIRIEDFHNYYENSGIDDVHLRFLTDILNWYKQALVVCNMRVEYNFKPFDIVADLVKRLELKIEESSIPYWMENETAQLMIEYFFDSSPSQLYLVDEEIINMVRNDYNANRRGISIFIPCMLQIYERAVLPQYKVFEWSKIRKNLEYPDQLNLGIIAGILLLFLSGLCILLDYFKSPPFLNFFITLPLIFFTVHTSHQVWACFSPTAAKVNVHFTLQQKNHGIHEIMDERVSQYQLMKSKHIVFLSKIISTILALLLAVTLMYAK
eukprot:NODE_140_length_16098_cov_0.678605.p8 type:complete len:305 gc:universal NODE_140_length_16098_cov_0.678605:14224-15138(+)